MGLIKCLLFSVKEKSSSHNGNVSNKKPLDSIIYISVIKFNQNFWNIYLLKIHVLSFISILWYSLCSSSLGELKQLQIWELIY